MSDTAFIEIRNAAKSFGAFEVLKDINLTVDRDRASALNVPVSSVATTIRAFLAGDAVSDRLDLDPAIASSVFVTTVTDVVGFFAFLGLAAWWFGI